MKTDLLEMWDKMDFKELEKTKEYQHYRFIPSPVILMKARKAWLEKKGGKAPKQYSDEEDELEENDEVGHPPAPLGALRGGLMGYGIAGNTTIGGIGTHSMSF